MYTQERPGGPGPQVLTMRRLLIVVAVAFLPSILYAQGRGAAPAMARPAAAPHVAMHAAPSVGARTISQAAGGAHVAPGSRLVRTRSGALVLRPPVRGTNSVRANGTFGSNRPLLSQDTVPGLGFDYAHFAATHPQGVHHHNRDRGFIGGFVPFFSGGGYYMPIGTDDIEEAPTDTQQTVTADAAPAQPAMRPGDYDSPRARRASSDTLPAAEKESEQYVFVRRDGTVFFAVAYSWENGTLRYITSEGLRRSVTNDKLDLDATQQFNEQRGVSFHLPV